MKNPSTFRLGELAVSLHERAARESKAVGRRITSSLIIKRALRAYLGNETGQHFDASGMIEELAKLRSSLARVGSNLNQLAHGFNIYGKVEPVELRKTHEALQAEFSQIVATMRGIELELYKRR